MKRITKRIVIGLAVLAAIAFFVWRDYAWADSVISKYQPKGWAPAARQENVIYLHKPWTIIKPPAIGVWFVRFESMMRLTDDIAVAEVMNVDREEGVSVYFELFDCRKMRTVIFTDYEKIRGRPLESLDWFQQKRDTPAGLTIAFVITHLELMPRGTLK